MGMEDTECIVDTTEEDEAFADEVHRNPRDRTGYDTHDDGGPTRDNTGCGCDGDETGDHTLDRAEDGRFLVVEGIEEGPGEEGSGGTDIGIEHRNTCIGIGGVLRRFSDVSDALIVTWLECPENQPYRVTTIKSIPSDPENTRTNHDKTQITRSMFGPIDRMTRTDTSCCQETCSPRRDVNNVSTRIIDDAELVKEAAAPDREGDGGVGEGYPEWDEEHPSEEIHSSEYTSG